MPASAATYYVPYNYATIQAAINASVNGDTVEIADGTYTGTGNVDLDFGGRNIIVTSQHGAASTIIDCQGSSSVNHRGIYLHSGETNAIIIGLTIENGYETAGAGGIENDNIGVTVESCILKNNTGDNGGGIDNLNSNYPIIIANCTFIGNTAAFSNGSGGGIYNDNEGSGPITIYYCTFTNNTASNNGNGGGISNQEGSSGSGQIIVTNCTLTGNRVGYNGGGIYNANGGNGTISVTNCTINSNLAHSGGGIYNANGGSNLVTLTNCTVSSNTAQYGAGIYNVDGGNSAVSVINCTLTGNSANSGGGGIYNDTLNSSTVTLTNDIFYGDTGGEIVNDPNSTSTAVTTYCDVQGSYVGTGNINANPLFVNAPTDLHLQLGSPCFGKGTANGATLTDKDGRTRPNPPSIGAYDNSYLFVSPSGSDSNPGTQAAPFLTIQAAINVSVTNSTVIVADGTYTGPGDVDLDFGGRNITVTSQNGAASTIIDCQGTSNANHRGFYIHDNETAAVIIGFTIKNGYETSNFPGGGGICIAYSSASVQNCTISGNTAGEGGGVCNFSNGGVTTTVTLTGCTISGNTTQNGGGGVYNSPGYGNNTVTLTGCTVSGNTAQTGGGVCSSDGSAGTNMTILTGCTISGNAATYDGGGIYNSNDGINGTTTINLTNCTVSGNTAQQHGGGVYNYNRNYLDNGNDTITVTNCTVSGNTAQTGGGVYNFNDDTYGTGPMAIALTNCTISGNIATSGCGGVYNFNYNANGTGPVTITLTNCIVFGDTGGEIANDANSVSNAVTAYCDIQGGFPGTGNINVNPLFVNAPTDLHLQTGSPCTGTGTATGAPTTDKDGRMRPNPPSIGAYEGPNTVVTAANVTGAVGTTVTLSGTLKTLRGSPFNGKTLTFQVGTTTVGTAVTNASGVATISYAIPPGTPTGPQTLTVFFAGQGTYTPSSGTATLTVTAGKANTAVTVANITGTTGTTVMLTGTLKTSANVAINGETLTFKVGTTTVGTAVTNASGIATLSYAIPAATPAGTQMITVSFAGDTTNTLSSGTGTLTVTAPNTVTTAANVSGASGTSVTLSATLKTKAGTPFNGYTLTFMVGTTTVGTAVTNSSGVASLSYAIPPGTPAGTKTITVSFAGQGVYSYSSGTATLTVQ